MHKMHAEAAVDSINFPGSQKVQEDCACTSENVPKSHSWQCVAPVDEYLPGSHDAHESDDDAHRESRKVPAVQFVHTEAPSEGEYLQA